MARTHLIAALCAALSLPLAARAQSAPEPSELPFSWPVPDGWRSETIPFPLEFAPEIRLRGIEELRFSPGMFEPGRDDFFTYAFVWWLEGDPPLDAASLSRDLELYFEGLSRAVESDPSVAAAAHEVEGALRAERDAAGHRRYRGRFDIYDAFATHARVSVHVEVAVLRCEAADRDVAFFLVSSQPREHALWTALERLRASFSCCAG